MDLIVEGNQQRLTVKIIGEISAENTADLREAINALVARAPLHIILDIHETTFIDSMGLGALVGLRGSLKKYNCNFTVVNPQPRVLEVLRLTRMAALLGLPEN